MSTEAELRLRRRRRRRLIRRATIGFSLFAIVIAAGLYLTSSSFQNTVRRKLVTELERVTGARVEMKHFRWNVSRLEAEAIDVTLHGLEGPDEIPYAHADRLYARAKILSFFGREVGLRDVRIEHPVIHIIVFPDGSTNQPVPKVKTESKKSPVERLFELQVDHAEIVDGMLLFNDHRIPFNFSGNDVKAEMGYDLFAQRYNGKFEIGQMDARYTNFLPVRSNLQVEFSLARSTAELKALHWASAKSRIDASGSMENFNDPRIKAAYQVSLDLAELGAISRTPQLRSGKLAAGGQGTYTVADISTSGRVTLQNVTWAQPGMEVPGLNASANYSATRDRISISSLTGTVYGGRLSGQADVFHWSEAAEKTGARTKPTAGQPQRGLANLKLSGISVAQVAAALSTPRLPLSKVQPVGAADGTLDLQWLGSPRNFEANIALDVAPPPNPAPQQLPVNARVRAAYQGRSQVIQVAELSLATRATRLNAAGTFGSETARLNVALNTNDLREFEPALAALHRTGPLPVQVNGRASFTGRVFGKLAQPSAAGHLEVTDFDTILVLSQNEPPPEAQPAAGAPAPPPQRTRVHWDSLVGDVEYTPSLAAIRQGTLTRGKARLDVEASAQLVKGAFNDSTAFQARLGIRDADVKDLQTLLGYDYPVTGTLNASLTVTGTRNDMRGGGGIQLAGGSIYGEPYKSLTADLRLAGREAQLNNLVFAHNGARITGNAAYDTGANTFRFDLRGADFQLAGFRQLQTPRFTVEGVASFSAQGSGTVEEPVINGKLSVRNLVLNGEETGDLEASAVTHGPDMKLTARSHLENAELALDGDVRLRGDFPAQMRLRFAHVDIDPILRAYLQGRVTGHSQMVGAVDVSGPLRSWRRLTVQGSIDQISAEIEKLRINNQGPIRFAMANEVLRVESLHLVGDQTDLQASGSVGIGGAHELDVRADGRVNLKLVQTFNRDLLGYGETTLALNIRGTTQKPQMQGRVEIREAGISFIDLPNGLSNINGALVFNENRLQVEKLTAKSGGGLLELGGFISYANGIYFNLSAHSGDIRLRYPPGVSALANADLRFVGTTANSLLSGDVTVTRFGLNPRFDFALYLARSKQPPAMPKPDSPLNNLRFDVHIVSTPELQVETSLAKVSGNVDLHLRGTAAHPVILGKVNVIQGDVFFNSTKYHLERGDITLTNPVRIEPVLNIEASARVREYDITLGFHGTLDKLSTTYHSDPPLPTGDIIALLALGRTQEEQVLQPTSQQSFTETASNAILGQALNATISQRAQKLFGISKIKIDPQAGGPESNPNARVTIEQQVSDKVTLTYITNLTQSAQQIIQVEFNINRNVSIVAVRDQNGVVGFDIKLRSRKR
ncbi:MAG TPA: translocation/assembly module TamB domain-containing protein [Terriglobales bacterium]|nr:translocation/assembly module TamB domain-containing protein [Terriglobales bacterium]